ncbi:ABC transporter ATP-binding protein [Mycolicibacterium septicum]|uniref:ABC transporter ATP-binding protein n=1 Tax=Mycolicibacterium septicum TaxID=98668 RepID=UPI0023E28F2B|nr:ABC transporter ATP-binding protein [Mycolicibacterium septicum]MDF3337115.1 ABC transporter ATP-binding protein [Mycolicibacterium septicum]
MAAVTIRGLTKQYGDTTVVDSFDLDIAEGEFVTLLGPSGCGKTTTLRCVAGLEKPDEGEISIDGRVVVSAASNRFVPPEKRGAGMVFQSYALWPHLTVRANVGYPLRMRHHKRAQIAEAVQESLAMVGLAHLADRSVSALSGGQQQRVALARALVANPSLLLFDEPLSNLDAKMRAAMRAELRAMRDRVGTTSLYVTHDQLEALTLSDRIVVMRHGAIHQIGTPEQIYADPVDRFVADFVGFDNFLTGTVVEINGDTTVVKVEGFPSALLARSSVAAEYGPGETVTLALRANSIDVESPASDGIPADIAQVSYLGEQVEYQIRIGSHSLISRVPVPIRWAQSDRVAVVLAPRTPLVVKENR